MRAAEARRRASTISTSSIRWLLVGAQVGWTTNTSWPRTFSQISMLLSPSENWDTVALPRGTKRFRAISSASSRLALPEKTIKLATVRSWIWMRTCKENGWGGRTRTFERSEEHTSELQSRENLV